MSVGMMTMTLSGIVDMNNNVVCFDWIRNWMIMGHCIIMVY